MNKDERIAELESALADALEYISECIGREVEESETYQHLLGVLGEE